VQAAAVEGVPVEELAHEGAAAGPAHVLGRVILGREHTTSLGDNAPLGSWIRDGLKHTLDLENITIGTFTPPPYPKLMLAGNFCSGMALLLSANDPRGPQGWRSW
jgi:hypothetical protein